MMLEYLFLETGFPVHACLIALVIAGIKVLKNE